MALRQLSRQTFSAGYLDLHQGRLQIVGLLPGASNYTFLAELTGGEAGGDSGPVSSGIFVVYKPRRGEAPLWDFPAGTLCQREVAAYEVARSAGWDFVPPTVLRDGPLGEGAVQTYIEHDPATTAFELVNTHRQQLKQMAVFDLIANNADRKAGHVLLDDSGKIWGVDHGLCFNEEPKLRTVLWDFIGEPIGKEDLEATNRLCDALDGDLSTQMNSLLSGTELGALRSRIRRVLDEAVFPPPETSRPIPWPPV